MSNNYKLKFTPVAYNDLEQIYQYIAGNLLAEQAANNLIDKIEERITRLKSFPYSGSYVGDDILKSKGYRKLILNNYIVFYLVDEQEKQVVIMRILYGASQYENLL
ncbi:MAG: toxin ParE1/3/4 [Thermoanaerobacteraceae bacterium]|jgi:addiction module RelE/StbE family toxin|uniref:Type II toxin-antitoxin system mRNA interferase toxin, RelE/StbE family n=1 Tax=Biomaibacter acetigenes TaxID=2316383 RepID=A0A3G2R8X9_9FIRM|nr:type II toxin-antitoxin system RelE/ParE family toxin [Biomaibacter acetigenes]AYO31227.1 type II toxin-antitoxin system mRNA interferase toxin, RelE/StbE family [Biomaibacter acetigenes]MDK2879562.1 toxin ParE1/3/4 [Thermoanaerobacteraceae bacterium]MDN5301075.1 toxin ParE1/3/4 [Thermoanaerobacteraceae bacterium]RKL64014.1 type II toxin-antitoxin system RelE/ParE family toxin [Thermoanaerobacteraceae bacterium SP2]